VTVLGARRLLVLRPWLLLELRVRATLLLLVSMLQPWQGPVLGRPLLHALHVAWAGLLEGRRHLHRPLLSSCLLRCGLLLGCIGSLRQLLCKLHMAALLLLVRLLPQPLLLHPLHVAPPAAALPQPVVQWPVPALAALPIQHQPILLLPQGLLLSHQHVLLQKVPHLGCCTARATVQLGLLLGRRSGRAAHAAAALLLRGG
jgi:hypothetical protein